MFSNLCQAFILIGKYLIANHVLILAMSICLYKVFSYSHSEKTPRGVSECFYAAIIYTFYVQTKHRTYNSIISKVVAVTSYGDGHEKQFDQYVNAGAVSR